MRKVLGILVLLIAVTVGAGVEAQEACLLTYVTESLPGIFINEPVNFQIDVCCGTPPYRFEIIDGTLPEGLHLNKNGKLTGKASAEADVTVLVLLTDAAGCSLGQAFPVRVMVREAAAAGNDVH